MRFHLLRASASTRAKVRRSVPAWAIRIVVWLVGVLAALVFCVATAAALSLAIAWHNLPDFSALSTLSNYPFTPPSGTKRRDFTPLKDMPKVMIDAVVAAEDPRFYVDHGSGHMFVCLVREIFTDIKNLPCGSSTITVQVARYVAFTYFVHEKTHTRVFHEMLLTFKLEHQLTKDQILEIYMNQIFLGNHAWGFAAASQAYFGKPIKDITIAQAAMLAALPKSPSANNPLVNPERARERRLYVIDRMAGQGFITPGQAQQAKTEPLNLQPIDSDLYGFAFKMTDDK